jgi:hypothetical protein
LIYEMALAVITPIEPATEPPRVAAIGQQALADMSARHAGQDKIQCQYCHYSVGASSEPGIPSLQTCMGCHQYIGGTDSTHQVEIRKVLTAWNDQQPIQWVRIHKLAKHAHFPHMRHVKAMGPTACATCHGDVARMPQVYKVNNVNNMGFCISCHVERNVSRDCTVCHY